ncbi:class I SAM-dependent methyltransferase [Rhizobium sp. Leaf341]|uniref:class I SAM-dependent methyltransferase n=1 Tax=Rhizobium sp. Leaf341 TaxID=1736344 RepID=UPI00071474B5|nr:class I SAM-dependent methyltransferase [Rhizobium sp. Leaf341]KQR75790.1 hypothetical protein ASG03_19175 [Rhizobium sp. Leaf341]
MSGSSTNSERYAGQDYLAENPTWHEEDAPWKAGHIAMILRSNGIDPRSICEVGCGTGAILEVLAQDFPKAAIEGFEIAPAAYERSLQRASPRLAFTLGSPFDTDRRFDLCMAIDVIEHVESPFEFVRAMHAISTRQVFHIPLDMNALAVGRGWVLEEARQKIGHLHYFDRSSALALLRECGLDIVDSFYTPWAIDQSGKTWKKRLAAYPRRIAYSVAPHGTVRMIGGWSLMVLTQSR